MYSRAHQKVSKRGGYMGNVHGRTKRGIDKRQKAMMIYSAWVYARWISLPLPLSDALSFSLALSPLSSTFQ